MGDWAPSVEVTSRGLLWGKDGRFPQVEGGASHRWRRFTQTEGGGSHRWREKFFTDREVVPRDGERRFPQLEGRGFHSWREEVPTDREVVPIDRGRKFPQEEEIGSRRTMGGEWLKVIRL